MLNQMLTSLEIKVCWILVRSQLLSDLTSLIPHQRDLGHFYISTLSMRVILDEREESEQGDMPSVVPESVVFSWWDCEDGPVARGRDLVAEASEGRQL